MILRSFTLAGFEGQAAWRVVFEWNIPARFTALSILETTGHSFSKQREREGVF